ncbi:hypothetical protein AY601_2014 [Pedobacter cryoconitis]|uniref:CorA-like Mg2+ transporter protein n=1 Tax=Pedobacter cryoconitis TaxID=188932 RepID=A0A127VCH6_9SPHI|nr:hypothetical protein [Pedobacter cryoconitis]AMP98920.1 hypothetical protein AY601_2014 [Pedobacter cryoconitis]
MTNSAPQLQAYSIQFCGMFNFSPIQREMLKKQPMYQKAVITDQRVRSIISRQYYSAFRPFILNDCPDKEYMELISVASVAFRSCTFADYKQNGQAMPSPVFNVQKVSITFYNEQFRTGIYSFEIRIVDAQGAEVPLNVDELSRLVKFAREFDSKIIAGGQTMSISEFIEKKMLVLNSNGDFISISEQQGSVYYNGSKLKTWITADLANFPAGYEPDHALFELGTSAPYLSASTAGDFRPSQLYFDSIIGDKISVFDNWSALCLHDSFILLASNYLLQGEIVWRDTYLKIYKFNLYCKFYLFKVNSQVTTKGKLSVTRTELARFLNLYNMEMISYNFLPNLIFANIKEALGIHGESIALMEKIENSSKIFREESDRLLNILLAIIAFTSLVSVMGDFSALVAKLYGNPNPSMDAQQSNTWIALLVLLALIIFVTGRYFLRKRKL